MEIFEKILFPFGNRTYLYIVVLCAISAFIAYIYIRIAYRLHHLSILLYVKIEQYFFSLFLSIICFNIFYFHYALLVWLLVFPIFCVLEKRNQTIKCFFQSFNKFRTIYFKNDAKVYQQIIKDIYCEEKPKLGLINYMCRKKKALFENIRKTNFLNKKLSIFSFIPLKTYLIGLIVPTINNLVFGKQYNQLDNIWLLLLESWIFLFSILYCVYPLFFYLTVENEIHLLFGQKKLFKAIFFIFSAILFAVFAGILFT